MVPTAAAWSGARQSRHDLRQQEQRWGAAYEHAAIIVEIDAEGRFLRVNEAICPSA